MDFDIKNGILYSVVPGDHRDITLPQGIDAIWFDAFASCKDVVSITISPGIKYIKGGVFLECISLKELCIPDSVKKIHVFDEQYIENCKLSYCPGGYSEFRNAASGFKVICGKDSFAEKYCQHFHIPFDIK